MSFPRGFFLLVQSLCSLVYFPLFVSDLNSATNEPHSSVFESSIFPILQNKCLNCHGDESIQAGLDLSSQKTIRKGGKSGPAIFPGFSNQSLLVEKVLSGVMPPGEETLAEEEIQILRSWIDQMRPKLVSSGLSEKDVLPIFLMRCIVCHGKRKQEGELDLRTRATRLQGGKSGPALVPGNPESSLLFQRIVTGEMPPPELLFEYRVRPPSTKEVNVLRTWIIEGAPLDPPRDSTEEVNIQFIEEKQHFWSFQTPRRPIVPKIKNVTLVRNPVDAFLLKKLEAHDLTFSPEANRLTLVRRAYLDLIGMPPTATQIRSYLENNSSDSYEQMIEDLLASPHYGERWAQHWLDVAGYADTEGIKHADRFRPQAWRYRDYVIRSFNQDKSYNQFLTEQLAGDELVDYTKKTNPRILDLLTATGFLRLVSDPTDSPSNASLAEKMDVIHNEIQVLSSSVLGLTMECARCHDHKYDPISQRDYYRFSAILQSAYDPYDWLDPSKRYLEIATKDETKKVNLINTPIQAEIDRLEKALENRASPLRNKILEIRLSALPKNIREDLRTLLIIEKNRYNPIQKYLQRRFKKTLEVTNENIASHNSQFKVFFEEHKQSMTKLKKKLHQKPAIRALFDMGGEPSPAYFLRRGEANSIGNRVYPGIPIVLRKGLPAFKPVPPRDGSDSTGYRLALARWLTHPNHPLTSRVLVNRVWMHHFGHGIVKTPSDFGHTGSHPSHPELLDWLATRFVDTGWSIKSLHRLLMTSTAYRQSSRKDPINELDPNNQLWSRMPMRRMEAEVLYDSMLKTTGRLDPKPFGPADSVEKMPDGEVIAKGTKHGWRRAIYTQKRRLLRLTFLDLFDAPQMAPNCTQRRSSTVATQALQLMNGYMVGKLSLYLAGRLMDIHSDDINEQITELYLRTLSRLPTKEESKLALNEISNLKEKWTTHLNNQNDESPRKITAHWSALGSMAQALLSSAEFSYID